MNGLVYIQQNKPRILRRYRKRNGSCGGLIATLLDPNDPIDEFLIIFGPSAIGCVLKDGLAMTRGFFEAGIYTNRG